MSRKLELKAIYDECRQAIEEEKLYWIRNDAKIRAAVTSQNYDEFRDIVAAAHLKPLTRDDKSKKTEIGWNRYAEKDCSSNGERE